MNYKNKDYIYKTKKKSIASATLTIVLISILSKIFGFIREAVIAQQYGATSVTDAFLVVFNIPYMANGILNAALVVVVVPVFLEYIVQGKAEKARRLFSTVFLLSMIVLSAIVIVCIWKSKVIINILAPGFSIETTRLASDLAFIMFPAVIFFALTNFFAGILNASNIFAPPASAPLILNLVIIALVLILGSIYGVYAAAIGVFLGTGISALIQLPFLRKTEFKFRAVCDYKDPGVRRVFGLMFPILVGSAVGQLNTFVYYFFGSGLVEGTISALNYATKLILLPQGIFVMAISTAIFPSLSKSAAVREMNAFSQTLVRGMKLVVLMAVPAVVGLMVLRVPIVALLFKRGAFGEEALILTSGALLFLSFGLLGQCLTPILTRGFFALQDTVTPVKITVITVAVNIVLSIFLVKFMGHLGLALANSIVSTIGAILLAVILMKYVPELFNVSLFIFFGKVLIASTLMGISVYLVEQLFVTTLLGNWRLLYRVALEIGLGSIIYFAVGFILKTDEIIYLSHLGKSYINKISRIINV